MGLGSRLTLQEPLKVKLLSLLGGPGEITKWGFPKIRGTFLGVPVIRAIVFWGLSWGPLV